MKRMLDHTVMHIARHTLVDAFDMHFVRTFVGIHKPLVEIRKSLVAVAIRTSLVAVAIRTSLVAVAIRNSLVEVEVRKSLVEVEVRKLELEVVFRVSLGADGRLLAFETVVLVESI